MIIDAAFKWPVAASYRIKTDEPAGRRRTLVEGDVPSGLRLVPKGRIIWKQPFRVRRKLSQELVRLIDSHAKLDEAVIQFASKYGMLNAHSEPGDWEPLSAWENLAKSLRRQALGKRVTARIGLHELRRTKTGAIALVPNTLKSGLECEAFLMGWSGEIKQCPGCGAMFEVGGDSGKRSHAEFCSDDCRYAFRNRVKADFVARNRRAGFTTTEIDRMWGRTKGR